MLQLFVSLHWDRNTAVSSVIPPAAAAAAAAAAADIASEILRMRIPSVQTAGRPF